MSQGSKPDGPNRRTAISLSLAAGSLLFASASQAQVSQAPLGTVEETRGEVNAEREGQRRKLQPKGQIFAGDVISTGDGALLVLKLGAATTIKLGAQARLKVEQYLADAGGVFDMQAGHLMFERKGKQATDGITFRSAYGLIAVRGTRFYAGPNRGAFAVLVGEGRVEVTSGGRTVQVRPQEGIDIKGQNQAPTTPAPWAVPRIREMLANFR
jgi:hypothetical protein